MRARGAVDASANLQVWDNTVYISVTCRPYILVTPLRPKVSVCTTYIHTYLRSFVRTYIRRYESGGKRRQRNAKSGKVESGKPKGD